MSKYNITQRVRAAVDRDTDPYLHIDMVREELEEHLQRIHAVENELRAVKVSLQRAKEWTETGIWKSVKIRLNQNRVGWMVWATRAALCGLGAAALSAVEAVGWLAWKGLNK